MKNFMYLSNNFVTVQHIEMMILVYWGTTTHFHIFKTVILQTSLSN